MKTSRKLATVLAVFAAGSIFYGSLPAQAKSMELNEMKIVVSCHHGGHRPPPDRCAPRGHRPPPDRCAPRGHRPPPRHFEPRGHRSPPRHFGPHWSHCRPRRP